MFEKPIHPWRVEITDMMVWKDRWDQAGELMEKASDSASWALGRGFLEARFLELAPKILTPKERRRIYNETDDLMERIIAAIQDGRAGNTQRLILDTATEAYEVAATPDDGDLQEILYDAAQAAKLFEHIDYSEAWDRIASTAKRRSVKDWRPEPFPGDWTFDEVSDELRNTFRYERATGHYDRYIVFEYLKAIPVQKVFKFALTEKEEGEILSDLRFFMDGVVYGFGWRLARLEIDVDNRYDFIRQWIETMKRDDWVDPVRKEIKEILEITGE